MKWLLVLFALACCIVANMSQVSELERAVWIIMAVVSFTGGIICYEIERK